MDRKVELESPYSSSCLLGVISKSCSLALFFRVRADHGIIKACGSTEVVLQLGQGWIACAR